MATIKFESEIESECLEIYDRPIKLTQHSSKSRNFIYLGLDAAFLSDVFKVILKETKLLIELQL